MILPLLYGGIVGLSLGLTGGGGSIFAVPLLVYGLETGMRRAVALSLAVVGLTSLYGALLQARSGWWFGARGWCSEWEALSGPLSVPVWAQSCQSNWLCFCLPA